MGPWQLLAAVALLVFLPKLLNAAPLPPESWLENIKLLAHSSQDQSVVLQLPDGERRLLTTGQVVSAAYDLELRKVHPSRIELIARHGRLHDRQLRLWFRPGSASPQVISSALAPPVSQSLNAGNGQDSSQSGQPPGDQQ